LSAIDDFKKLLASSSWFGDNEGPKTVKIPEEA